MTLENLFMKRVVDWYSRLSTFGRSFTIVFVLHMLGLLIAFSVAVPTLHPLFWVYVVIFGGLLAATMSLLVTAGVVVVNALAWAFERPYRSPIQWLGSGGVMLGWLLSLLVVPAMGPIGMVAVYAVFFSYFGPAVGVAAGLMVGGLLHAYQRLRCPPKASSSI